MWTVPKNIVAVLTLVFICSVFLFPVEVYAVWTLGDPLVPCGTKASGYAACDFNALIQLIQNLISFLIQFAVIAAAPLLFAYAGFLYLTSGDNVERRKTAHRVFTDTIVGLIIMLVAFLVVYIITSSLLKPGYNFLLEKL